MSFDTQDINKTRVDLSKFDEIWLFAYGSLIYKVDFPILASEIASIKNWQRRFWQGSHDHRGTEDNPGRVLTLIHEPGAMCQGIAYQVSKDVFEYLDYREKNGYLRSEVAIQFADGSEKTGLIYIADEHNEAYLGPATERQIAEHIHRCEGPSGSNADYVLNLAQTLRANGLHDDHVFHIEQLLATQVGAVSP